MIMDNRQVNEEEEKWDGAKIDRSAFSKFLLHSEAYYRDYFLKLVRSFISSARDKSILVLGAYSWYPYIYRNGISPKKITCINISKNELLVGLRLSSTITDVEIEFKKMDAHSLAFKDNSFDIIFGTSILHHLDFNKSLKEIRRVLKNNGQIIFREPLGINPITNLIRFFTPKARTKNERPLRLKELKLIKDNFVTDFYFEQLWAVFFSAFSSFVFKNPKNVFTKTGFFLDLFFEKNVPLVKFIFRSVIIKGIKR